MNVIREVARRADIAAVISRYGDIPMRGRMFSCPFHGEDKHPSASIRNGNRWICYACGKKGDAVDFVSMIRHISVLDAARLINEEFGLGVQTQARPLSKKEKEQQMFLKQRKEEEEARRREKQESLTKLHRKYVNALTHFAPKTLQDLDHPDPRYTQAVRNIKVIAYELDCLQCASE